LTPIIEWIEQQLASRKIVPEVLEKFPGLTELEAYRVQQATIQRRIAKGDRLAGMKAAMTSKAMRESVGLKEPVLGHLLQSGMLDESKPVSIAGFVKATIEPEVGVILKAPLQGPGVTRAQALAAIAGYAAAIEIGDIKTGDSKRSPEQTLICNVMNGGQVAGSKIVAPDGIDLRAEGMVVSINGEVRASATAVEVLGDPINSVLFIANKLGELAQFSNTPLRLEPGWLLMTGSIVRGIPVQAGDHVEVEFTRLGRVSLRFTA
jgi:2-keto-4-pentenoate hydratase